MILNVAQLSSLNKFHNTEFRNIKVFDIGIINLVKLNSFLNKCNTHLNENITLYKEALENGRKGLIDKHPDKKDLLNGYFVVDNNPVTANNYINEHPELNDIISDIKACYDELHKFADELNKKEYDIDFSVNVDKFMSAIEAANVNTEAILEISFLFNQVQEG